MTRLLTAVLVLVSLLAPVRGDDARQPDNGPGAKPAKGRPVPLNEQRTILLDKPGGRLLLKTEVVLRAGVLEMLCCKKNTKEHESIVALDGKAHDVNVGLVAIGAKAGKPVSFDPSFTPPSGTKLDIRAIWADNRGRLHSVPADTWVRHVTRRYYMEKLEDGLPEGMKPLPEDGEMRWDDKHRELIWFGPMTKKERDELLALSEDETYRKAVTRIFDQGQNRPMEADFVFAGSGWYVEEQTGEKFFQAESGDVICVANFASALVDVAQRSTADGEANLLYEVWTERVPPLGTSVTLEITIAKEKAEPAKDDSEVDAKPE